MNKGRNRLGFRIERRACWTAATILIDGKSLIRRAREFERKYAEQEGQPSLAGSYCSLSVGETFLPCRLLYGEPFVDEDWFIPEKCPLLTCECTCFHCWDLNCRIRFETDTVVWAEFQHSARAWDYSGFGPFVFERQQYLAALSIHMP